jgi:hypothetical protein
MIHRPVTALHVFLNVGNSDLPTLVRFPRLSGNGVFTLTFPLCSWCKESSQYACLVTHHAALLPFSMHACFDKDSPATSLFGVLLMTPNKTVQ